MGRKRMQHGKTMPEVSGTSDSEKKQQEIIAATEDLSDKVNSDKVYTIEDEDFSLGWYAEWPQLEKLLTFHLSFRSEEQVDSDGAQPPPGREAADVSILVPGCGRSKLSEYMYDAGFKNITNLDYSKDVICDMLKKNVKVRPEMKWRIMDSTNMQFANETFDAIVDKGGLDSLMKTIPGSSLGSRYLSHVKRVLKAGGKYVCLSLAKRLVLDLFFRMFRFGWKISLYAIGQEASSLYLKLQTFMLVAEKKSSPAVYAISSSVGQNFFESNSDQACDLLELLLREKRIRSEYDNGADIVYSLEDLQLGAIGNFSKPVPGRRVKLSIGRPDGFTYNGVLLDAKEDSGPFTYPYAVLLVPQNKAHDWMYTSEEGQWRIFLSSEASRLLMILLDSSNSNLSMDYIQMDLSPSVILLEPEDCGEGFKVPYLRAADEMNKREIVYEGSSVFIGPIIVEDVIYQAINDDDYYKKYKIRRLIFKKTEYLVQSQALLSIKESNRISTDVLKDKEQQASKSKKKGKQRKSDSQSSRSPVSSGEVKVVHNHLISLYHSGIVLGIRLISSYLNVSTSARGLVRTVVIGLGGGLLPMFLKKYLPFLKIEVVELERKVLHVAREYFGFSDDESLQVHITDGIKFVKEKADENSSCKVDILVVDVHSSDTSSGLSCPAADFVDESFLLTVKDSLSEQGLFIINLVAGPSALKIAINSRLKKVFSCILSLPIHEGMDEVVFAFKTTDSPIKEDQLSEACNELAKSLEHEKKLIKKQVGLSQSIKLLN